MDLQSRVDELKRLGFDILEQTDDRVDAIRCKWHLDLVLTQVTALVRVRKADSVDNDLLLADRRELTELLKTADPSSLPRGFQKGTVVVSAYLCDTSTEAARATAEHAPIMQFATFHIAGIRDGDGIHTYTGTRIWGAIFYPLLKFLTGAMLDPRGEAEPTSVSGMLITVLTLVVMLGSLFLLFTV